jgi:hypothetical protein
MKPAPLESTRGAERCDDFSVLIRKYGSQVEFELALFNEPDDWRHMRTQPRRYSCGLSVL